MTVSVTSGPSYVFIFESVKYGPGEKPGYENPPLTGRVSAKISDFDRVLKNLGVRTLSATCQRHAPARHSVQGKGGIGWSEIFFQI